MTVFVVNFSFLCAFTYACPSLALYAFAYNCIICNWYIWSHLRLQRRTVPIRCQGMPVWNSLMRFSMFFSVVVNAGMAAMVVNPMAGLNKTVQVVNMENNTWHNETHPFKFGQLSFFMFLEHALLLMIVLMMILV